MMRIGICDDSDISRQNMLSLCHEYFQNNIGKIEYCRNNMKSYMIPKEFVVVSRQKSSTSGKVARRR